LYTNTLDDYVAKCISSAKKIKNEQLFMDIVNNNSKDNDNAIIHLLFSDVPFT